MKNKKGNVAVIAIIIVIVVITAGVITRLIVTKLQVPVQPSISAIPVQKQSEAQSNEPVSTNDTSLQQIYSNEVYGFKFDYPLLTTNDYGNLKYSIHENSKNIFMESQIKTYSISVELDDSPAEGPTAMLDITSDSRIINYLQKEISNSSEKEVINEIEFTKFKNIDSNNPMYGYQGYIAQHENNYFILRFILDDEVLSKTILSSFNFTSSISSDEKIYKNDTLGLEFKYPGEFRLTEDSLSQKLFESNGKNNGHFWLKVEDNVKKLDANGLKNDFYANDEYGFQYEDSFISVGNIKTYKQGRYDLGVIENYFIPRGGNVVKLKFEFNFDKQNKKLNTDSKLLIERIISTLKFTK